MPNDPLWINSSGGAPAYDARELRRAMATLLTQAGTVDRFGARSGVHPGGSDAVSLAGSTITVQHTKAVIYEGTDALRGPYLVQLTGTTFTLSPADPSNARKDIVVARVYDHDEDASGQRKADPEYLVGTPAGSPVEPAVPAGAVRLATIDVPASPGVATLTYNAPYVVATGGVLPVRTSADLPTLGVHEGAYADQRDTDELKRWSGSAWQTVASAVTSTTDTGLVTAATGFSVTAFEAWKWGPLAIGVLSVTRTGTDITPDSAGNIADTLMCTLGVGWRPAVNWYSACGSGFSDGEARIFTDGKVELRSWTPGGVVATTNVIRIPFSFIKA